MTEPKVSSTEGQELVSPPGKGPIPPVQALYKVKSVDTEVLGGLRARPNEIKA